MACWVLIPRATHITTNSGHLKEGCSLRHAHDLLSTVPNDGLKHSSHSVKGDMLSLQIILNLPTGFGR